VLGGPTVVKIEIALQIATHAASGHVTRLKFSNIADMDDMMMMMVWKKMALGKTLAV